MVVPNFVTGWLASVSIGGILYSFDRWVFKPSSELVKITNISGGGYAQFLAGPTTGKIELSGPYDLGNMPFTVGFPYIVSLGIVGDVFVAVPTLLEGIEQDAQVEDALRVILTFQTDGAFIASIA